MKLFLCIPMLVFALMACNEPMPKLNQATDNEKLVKQYFEHFNNHNFVEMANMYADTSAFKDPTLGPGMINQTRQQIIDKYSQLASFFTNLHDTVISTYPSGSNHIIVEFISTGIGPDKNKFELPICTIFTIENGLITKDFTYFDNFENK